MNYTTTFSPLQDMYVAAGFLTSLVPDETTIWCCPSGLNVDSGKFLACEAWKSNFELTSCEGEGFRTTTYPTLGSFRTCTATTTTPITDEVQVGADVIYVKYRPTDLSVLQKVSPSWGITAAAETRSATTGSNRVPAPSSTSSSSHSGVSRKAKIAISAAIPAVLITILLAI